MRFETVVFDVDGTLVDNSEGILNCIRYAAEKLQLPVLTDEQLRVFIGPPLQSCAMDMYDIDDETAERFVKLFRERYAVKGFLEAVAYPGVPLMLKTLQKNGVHLAVATGKPQQFVEKVLQHLGLYNYFESIHGILFESKESDKTAFIRHCLSDVNVVPNHAAMVGDRKFDILSARQAGVFPVGVLYGFGSSEELETAGASLITDDVPSLCNFLCEI